MGAEELPKIRTTARRGRPDLLPYSLLLPSLVLLLVFFTVPLIMIVVFSFYTRDPLGSMIPALTLENYRKFFTEALYQVVLLKSLRFAATATVVTLLLGYPMAYFLARTKSRHRTILFLLVLAPFWTSVIVRTYAWMVVLGNNGIINKAVASLGLEKVQLMFNETGVIIGLTQIYLPYMVLSLYSSLSAIDERVEQAARTLGAGDLRTFWHIILPLSLPGVATGCLLTFILALSSYIPPAVMGGPKELVLPMLIQQQAALLNYPLASAAACTLLVLVVVLMVSFNRLVGLERVGKQV
jgi:ABC-type spermidine/putrescine transport system permease subunit I